MSDCFLMGHGGYALPKLDPSYPEDITLTSYNALATFSVKIAKEGRPKKYTYKWYFSEDEGKTFKEVSNGNDTNILQISGYNGEQTYQVYCKVSNKKGAVNSRVAKMTVVTVQPLFTYMVNGVDYAENSSYVKKDNWSSSNWKLSFLKSGTLEFINRGNAKDGIEAFCVGGGGGGGGSSLVNDSYGGGGGGGGEVSTSTKHSIEFTPYIVTVGSGGSGGVSRGSGENGNYGYSGGNGSASSISSSTGNFLCSAKGGVGGSAGSSPNGGSGGSGGGGGSVGWSYWVNESWGTYWESYGGIAGKGGSNGSNGSNAKHPHNGEDQGGSGGSGKGKGTGEFGNGSTIYAGGGSGGYAIGIRQTGVNGRPASATSGGGGASGKHATFYGGGGGGGNYDYGHSTPDSGTARGGDGYQGIVIIRKAS